MPPLAFYLQLLVILGAATALACWAGWGLARLALPDALQPYGGLLAPLLGYSIVIVVGYWFVRTVSGLPLALVVLLPITGALNLLAWRRGGPPRQAPRYASTGRCCCCCSPRWAWVSPRCYTTAIRR